MLPPVWFRAGSAAAAIASEVVLDDARPTRRRGRAFASAATIAAVLLAAYATWRWLEATGGAVALLERFGLMAPLVSIPVHVSALGDALPERTDRRRQRQRVRALGRGSVQLDRVVVWGSARVRARATGSPSRRMGRRRWAPAPMAAALSGGASGLPDRGTPTAFRVPHGQCARGPRGCFLAASGDLCGSLQRAVRLFLRGSRRRHDRGAVGLLRGAGECERPTDGE